MDHELNDTIRNCDINSPNIELLDNAILHRSKSFVQMRVLLLTLFLIFRLGGEIQEANSEIIFKNTILRDTSIDTRMPHTQCKFFVKQAGRESDHNHYGVESPRSTRYEEEEDARADPRLVSSTDHKTLNKFHFTRICHPDQPS